MSRASKKQLLVINILRYVLPLSIAVVITIKNTKTHKNKPNGIWKETVGTLDPRGYNKGTIAYEVNGLIYHADFKGITDKDLYDQKFTMRYDVGDPEEVKTDSWNPVFVAGEKTHILIAKIKNVQQAIKYWSPVPAVIYTYIIPFPNKPLEIERWIYLPKDFQKRYPGLKEGQYYEVEVGDKNIYRSVLHLDKPVSIRQKR